MSILNNNKKNEEINYDKCLEEFINFKDSIDRINECSAITKLYDEIYTFYNSKIKEDKLDIKIEKILLERRSGKYTSEKSKVGLNMINRDVMYNVCLKVLDDLEKENLLNANSFNSEAAATLENQQKEQMKYISNSNNNGNWNISISETMLLSMVKGAYNTAKFVGKLIRKKKR